jgi:hypothetical protein
MSLVDNERVKLTATWLNTLASATATVGVLAPLASFVYGLGQSPLSVSASLVAMAIWFSAALALHLGAAGSRRACTMTTELFFALYVAPLLLAAFGWAVALWAVRQAKKESRPPAE